MDKKIVLILYTEFSSYLEACFNCLSETKKIEIHLVRYPVNNEAPFLFESLNFKNYFKNEFNTQQALLNFTNHLNPDLILVSGWIDKDYLRVALKFKNKSVIVMAMDTQWTGSLKQKFMTFIAKNYFLKRFTYVWVPGSRQKKYAQNIGFSDSQIIDGFYSCNFDLFRKYYNDTIHLKRNNFPKAFLFVGRYVKSKGVHNLWNAFIELNSEYENDWELWCVGTGDEWDNKIKHPKIKHLGFVQPNDLLDIIQKSGIYILPSEFEPWGVSLHEFVSSGYPVIVSDKVGSSEIFVKEGKNGFIVKSGSVDSLKEGMKKVMKMRKKELLLMSQESVSLSEKITPKIWVDKLISLL